MNKFFCLLLLSCNIYGMQVPPSQDSPKTPSTPKELAESLSFVIYGRKDKRFSETFEKILKKRRASPELLQKRENYALILSSMHYRY